MKAAASGKAAAPKAKKVAAKPKTKKVAAKSKRNKQTPGGPLARLLYHFISISN